MGFGLLARHYGRRLSLDGGPPDDERTYDMMCRGNTVGVFQIESRARSGPSRRWGTSPAARGSTRGGVRRLAEAGVFARFEGKRRAALWEALGLGRAFAPSLALASREPQPEFEPLGAFETIAWDYAFSAHSTRGHPLAPLRDALTSRRHPRCPHRRRDA